MFVHVLLGIVLSRFLVNASIQSDVLKLCNQIKTLDDRICQTLMDLPKYEGEYVVKDLSDYNAGLNKLLGFLTEHRNATLEVEEAMDLLREGAPDYFKANIDPDKAKLHWGWLQKGLDEVFRLRAESIRVWTRLNRESRAIELQFYSYPEGANYTGYQNPNFPPLREKQ